LSEDAKRDGLSVASIRKCPICGGELEQGYLISGTSFWDKGKHTLRGGGKLLTKYPAFTNTNFYALRCSNCHIIIFDYENKS
jgi:hypothetical protein